MDNRASVELADFTSLFGGEGSEDIESKLLAPYRQRLAGGGIQEIDIALIDVFPNHPFKVIDDKKMKELTENIAKYGVFHPILVRPTPDGRYQMISGHRRTYASRKAGMYQVPARVMPLSDEEAAILMADANFLQRTEIKPSEKAKAYRMKFDAIKRQGRSGGSSFEEMGEAAKESGRTVQRFIRLSHLSDELLGLVDSGKLGISQGVELSFLNDADQTCVYQVIKEYKLKLKREQASQIKDAAKERGLTAERVLQAIGVVGGIQRTIAIKNEVVNQFFGTETSDEEIENIIVGLLRKWKEEQ